jgi:hypothetical protein
MRGMKKTIFAAVATAALVCLPIRPAAAAGPFLLAPRALGHIVLPLIAASAAASQQAAQYATGPAYYPGVAGVYPPRNYYAPPAAYFGPLPGYYPAPYYRPAPPYAPPMRSYYAPRGYYRPSPSYYGRYGGQGYAQSRGYSYRRG